jgi:hypothetical protein
MNNRQAGRRRGRGGQRSQGNPNQNSRIDSRQRGNANQLYEKYKNLARDAQMAGDRVNTEYYLQFADHYFRVLNENRARFEDNRRQRDDADEDAIDGEDETEEQARDARPRYQDESRFNGRGNGRARSDSDAEEAERPVQAAAGNGTDHAPQAAETEGEAPAPKRGRGRPRRQAQPAEEAAGLDADRLPPSLGAGEANEEKPRRRRTRTPAGEVANSAG